jgi:hypothetical protein
MNAYFHPWIGENRQVLFNALRLALRRWPHTLLHTAGWLGLFALLAYGFVHIDGNWLGLIIYFLADHPAVTLPLIAALGFAGTFGAITGLLGEWRNGWWGAMPVAARAQSRTLLLAATIFTLLQTLIMLAMLLAVASIASRWRTWLQPASTLVAIGIPLGAILGFIVARRVRIAPRREARRSAGGKPLFALAWLEHPRLPNLAHWQRRETLRRWRSGGPVWPFIALGIAIPMNSEFWTLAGLVLLAISAIWFGVAARANEDVIVRADAALAATPIGFARFSAATIRYPLWTWAIASLLGSAGLILQTARWPFVAGYAPALLLALLLQLSLTWRYRVVTQARWRFVVEAIVLLALFRVVGAFAIVLYAAFLFRHLQLARARR